MQLWKKIRDLTVTGRLRLEKGTKIVEHNAAGQEVMFNRFCKTIGAAYTIPESENGMTYILTTSGTDGAAVTLPPPKDGLRFKFVVGAAFATTAWTVVTNGSANIIHGLVLSADLNAANDGDTTAGTGADTITFAATLEAIGDWAEVVSDGTKWFVTAACTTYNGITLDVAS